MYIWLVTRKQLNIFFLKIYITTPYHANVIVYVHDSFVSTVLIQFWENKLFHAKHHSILSSYPNNCPV